MRTVPIALAALLCFGLACDPSKPVPPRPDLTRPGVTETAIPADDKIVAGQTLYVPLYSHVLTADAAHPLNLAATVVIRNTDRSRTIVVTRVEYFDSAGKSLRSFLKSPITIAPLASVDYFVPESDETGGASPSFLVEWVATDPVADPLAESIMIGTTGSQGISFTGTARVVESRKR